MKRLREGVGVATEKVKKSSKVRKSTKPKKKVNL